MGYGRVYTEEERAFMVEFVPGHSHKEIQEEFMRRFGPIGLNQIKAYIKNHKLNTGRTGRFEKGLIPHNKGKKMPEEVYRKAAPTMFKKGNKPANTDPIGTEKMLSDGYVWVKVDDRPKVPKKVNWKQKHRLIWEAEHGLIPEGCIITFLDGDKMNFDPDNLAMITRAQNVRMNQNDLRKANKELTRTGIILADLITKTAEAGKRTKKY